MAAANAQRSERLIAARREKGPNPTRIRMAFDWVGEYGPEVDRACGVEEPTVDQWEAGTLVPTPEQLEAISAYTGWPVSFFYQDDPEPVYGFVCGDDGCEVIDTFPRADVIQIARDTLW